MFSKTLNFDGFQAILCEQGADFVYAYTWDDIDLSASYTYQMQIKRDYGRTTEIELSTSNGRITTDTSGNIIISLTSTETSALGVGNYLYDIKATSGADFVSRVIEGEFRVKAALTI